MITDIENTEQVQPNYEPNKDDADKAYKIYKQLKRKRVTDTAMRSFILMLRMSGMSNYFKIDYERLRIKRRK